MKAIYFAALLLLACSFVNGGKMVCKKFPKKLSGKLLVFMDIHGIALFLDMPFNYDRNLHLFQSDMKINGKGPFNVVIDYKAKKKYVAHNGKCIIKPSKEKLPDPAGFKNLTLIAKGKLGLRGAQVGLYGFKKGPNSGLFTIEKGITCIAEGFVVEFMGGSMTGSYLDLKKRADSSKLKIPDECKNLMGRRSFLLEGEPEVIPLDMELPLFP